jgi:Rieske Fe-S protein
MKSRRDFIKKTAGISAFLCCGMAGTSLLQSCGSVNYITAEIKDRSIRIGKAEFADNTYLVIANMALPAPIYLHKVSEEEYTAFLMLCTHNDCELEATSKMLVCPCHGSEFDLKGEVTEGPAEKPLMEFDVVVSEKEIRIDLNR